MRERAQNVETFYIDWLIDPLAEEEMNRIDSMNKDEHSGWNSDED
ncbi:hypothetical protein [Alkalibacillus almallahensis]|nr:hypothetical protein [Alkalibacillus almallahensis]NIK13069.1 hypothetical protein [Alkalibacillus almallahensis]